MENEFKTSNYIVLSNSFIKLYKNDLTLRQCKLFRIAVSCIDTKKPSREVYISKKELWKFLDLNSDSSRYFELHNDIIQMQKLIFEAYDRNKSNTINVFSKCEYSYSDDEDYIYIKFNEDIMSFLVCYQEYFQYHLRELQYLKSKYSLLLFEHLLSEKWKVQRDTVHSEVIINVEEWKKLTNTNKRKSYERFNVWYPNIIDVAVNELNDKTSYYIQCDKIKTGKSIKKLKFTIRKKTKYEYQTVIMDTLGMFDL